jgi:hypothetical protein
MTVSAAEADQAISEGWARDPFAPVEEPKAGEEPKQLTDQEREELSNKARAAAERWRGEDKNESKAGKTETRDMAPAKDERSDYQTKTAAGPPKRR